MNTGNVKQNYNNNIPIQLRSSMDNNLLISKYEMCCSGCNKRIKGISGVRDLPIRLDDWDTIVNGVIATYRFCNYKCLVDFLRKHNKINE